MRKTVVQSVKISKITAVFAIFLISFLLFPLFTSTNLKSLYAADIHTDLSGFFKFTVFDNKATIVQGYTGPNAVEIPNPIYKAGDTDHITPYTVTSIGGGAFQGVDFLTSISIPSTVTSIGAYAFWKCLLLAKVTFEGATAPAFIIDEDDEGVYYNFYDIATDAIAYVPAGTIDAGYINTNYPFTGYIGEVVGTLTLREVSAINIAAIAGVTAPVTGAIPTPTIADTTEYTATISWSPVASPFAAGTAYTATITLTPKAGYTLTGIAKNFFTVSGATTTNTAGSGVVTAVFPATAAAEQTAAEVAAGITTISAPSKDATSLTLPTVPAGFTVKIKSSNTLGVIALNGTIVPPVADTMVALVLTVTKTSGPTTADTASINVVVPAKTTTEAPAPASTPPKPLTPEEIVALSLTMQQQVDTYGATNNGFIEMLYDNVLGRVHEDEGLNGWEANLNNAMTGSQVAHYFIFSAELAPTVNSLSDNDFIAFLYTTLLNRPHEPEGYAGWQEQMGLGMTREELVNHFVNSPEFAGICTLFNVTP